MLSNPRVSSHILLLTRFLTTIRFHFSMSGFEIFGVVAGVIGVVPLVREVRNALIMVCDHS